MSEDYEILKITTIDPITGEEADEYSYYDVGYFGDEGYAITRSATTLAELKDKLNNDFSDQSLGEHVTSHHNHIAL